MYMLDKQYQKDMIWMKYLYVCLLAKNQQQAHKW